MHIRSLIELVGSPFLANMIIAFYSRGIASIQSLCVMLIDKKMPKCKSAEGQSFINWLTSYKGQKTIGLFTIDGKKFSFQPQKKLSKLTCYVYVTPTGLEPVASRLESRALS